MSWEVPTMPSKTSFFSVKVYKNTLSRFWFLGAAYAAAWAFQLLQYLSVSFNNLSTYSYYSSAYQVISVALRSPIHAIACAITAMAVYGWLFQTRAAAFTSALPLRREAVFTANMAAGLTLLLGGNVLALVLTAMLGVGVSDLMPALGYWFAITSLIEASCFGLATLCAALTGSLVILPALYAVLLYAAVALEASLRRIAQFLIFGLSNQTWKLTVLSPLYYLAELDTYTVFHTEEGVLHWEKDWMMLWGPLAAYALAGLALAALAVPILRRRKMESAGDVVAVPALRKLFRWAAAFAVALSAGLMALQTVFGFSGYDRPGGSPGQVALLLVLMILGALVGWFGAQAMMKRTLRVFHDGWGGFGIICAVLCALVYSLDLDVLGVESRLPDPEQVSLADVFCPTLLTGTTFREQENIQAVIRLQEDIVANKKLFEQSEFSGGPSGGALTVRYFDRDGRLLLSRTYTAPAGEYAWASKGNADISHGWGTKNPVLRELQDLANRPEAVEERIIPAFPLSANGDNVEFAYADYASGEMHETIELTAQEAMDLYLNCVLPDIEDSTLGRLRLVPEEDASDQLVAVRMSFRYTDPWKQQSKWHYLDLYGIPADAVRTNAWLREHGLNIPSSPGDTSGQGSQDIVSWTAEDVHPLEGLGGELESLYLSYDPDTAGTMVKVRWARILLKQFQAEGADPFRAYEEVREFAAQYEARANRFPATVRQLREVGEQLAAGDLGLVREAGDSQFTPEMVEDLFDAIQAALHIE